MLRRGFAVLCAACGFVSSLSAATYHVDASATGDGSGSDWSNACTTLADAVTRATAQGDEIHVKGDLNQTAVVTIADHPGVAIRGGYTGEDETTRSGRSRLVRNSTTVYFRIFDISASTITLDGITVEKGYARVSGSSGQGVQLTGASTAVFTNCCFKSNGGTPGGDHWTQYGGAIGAQDGSLTVVDCEFDGNYLAYNNHHYPRGGAIYAKNESIRVVNSRFNKNYCRGGWDTVPKGGAIMLESCAQPVIDNCTFTTNYAWKSAGSSPVLGGTLHLLSCTDAKITDSRVFGGYIADSSGVATYAVGGQAFHFTDSTVAMSRSVFWNVGASGSNGKGVIDVEGKTSQLYLTNVLVSAAIKGWCLGNNNATVEAVNCTFTGVTNTDASRLYAGYTQNGGTASFANCIFWNLKDGRVNVRSGADPTLVNCSDTDADPLFADTFYCHPKSQAGRYAGGWFTGGTWTNDTETSTSIDGVPGLQTVATEPQPNGHHINLGYDGNTAVASKSYLDDKPVDPTTLQVLSYPDYVLQDSTHVVVYGTLAGTGGGETANVTLVWDSSDKGVGGSWAHTVDCGAQAPWALVSATMVNPAGTVYYRFYAQNAGMEVAWSSPARTLKTPAPPTIEYASPAVSHLYRTSVRVRVTMVDDVDQPSTVSVNYWRTSDPSVTNTVPANGGAAVAVGTVATADLTGLEPDTEYGYFATAVNSAGTTKLADAVVTTVATTTPMTLSAAPETQGLGDGTGFANATTIENAFAQATGEGDEVRLLAGDYTLMTGFTVANATNFTLRGGYTGEGDARSGRSRLVRSSTADPFRLLDISASVALVDGVSVEKGYYQEADGYGQGVRVRDNSSVTFTNCQFAANGGSYTANVTLYGGGLGCNGGTLAIVDCDFDSNYFTRADNLAGQGAGACINYANVSIRDSRFCNNSTYSGWDALSRGGALAFNSCPTVEIVGCVFSTNAAKRADRDYTSVSTGSSGGAIQLTSCPDVVIRESRFFGGGVAGGTAAGGGAEGPYSQLGLGHAICVWNSTLALTRSVFSGVGTQGSSGNGVIDVTGASARLFMTNVLMTSMNMGWAVGNSAGGTIDAVNCTFNRTYKSGKSVDGVRKYTGYSQYSDADTVFRGCIFWDMTNGVSYVKEGGDPLFVNCELNANDPLFGDTVYCHPKSRAGRYAGGYFAGGSWTNDTETSASIDAGAGFVTSGITTELQPNGCHVNQGYDGNTDVASKSDLGADPVVDPAKLQVYSYPDRALQSADEITVYGTVASTGGDPTDNVNVWLLWGDEDAGTDESLWDHKESCGTYSPWETVSGVIRNAEGTTWYRFYAVNASTSEIAYSAPARSFAPPSKAKIAIADPAVTHLYRTSVRFYLDLQDNCDLDTTVAVTYWPSETPGEEQTVYANFGQPVPTGVVAIAIADLQPGTTYRYRGEAQNAIGKSTTAEGSVTTVAADEAMTLNVAPEAQGIGDGTSWANATTLANGFAQMTGTGDTLRLKEGEYKTVGAMTIAGRENLTIAGGYTGVGETRGARSRIIRDATGGYFRVFDISASTVTVSCVTIEKGHVHTKGEIGHGIKVSAGADVTFTNCLFTGNGGTYDNGWTEYGAGLGATDCAIRVVDCEFNDNYMTVANNFTAIGTALYAKKTALSVVNSRFNRNYGHDGWRGATRGGAVALENCVKPILRGCTFNTNHVFRSYGTDGHAVGGTFWIGNCTGALIEDCRINGSWVGYNGTPSDKYIPLGQACYITESTVSLLNTVFYKTGVGGNLGGGVVDVLPGSTVGLTNVLIVGTTKGWNVGNKESTVAAANCTFSGVSQNTGDRTFAAYMQKTGGTATFKNTIYWDIPDGICYKTGGNDMTNSFCAAETALEGERNILLTASPFTDVAAEDFTLYKGSPCVNAGDKKGLKNLTDLAGNPRVQGGKVDLGVYETPYSRGFSVIVK